MFTHTGAVKRVWCHCLNWEAHSCTLNAHGKREKKLCHGSKCVHAGGLDLRGSHGGTQSKDISTWTLSGLYHHPHTVAVHTGRRNDTNGGGNRTSLCHRRRRWEKEIRGRQMS